MLKELLKNKKFLKIIEEHLKKPEIIDILLFGSITRGKETPKDIDLLVIYPQSTKEIIELNHALKKQLENAQLNAEITGKRYNEIFSPEFLARESILSEGFSMRQKKFLSECFGYKSFVLFRYSLTNLNKSRRMIFYYSLYGRGKEKGILEKNNSHKFSSSIIFAPVENSETIKSFLEKWELKYAEFPIIIPETIIKYNLLKK